ncbi:MAG: hypothetical protein LKK13_04365 [Bacilli bacterium]|nr:hypothetical protein [Bacilli bacterium]
MHESDISRQNEKTFIGTLLRQASIDGNGFSVSRGKNEKEAEAGKKYSVLSKTLKESTYSFFLEHENKLDKSKWMKKRNSTNKDPYCETATQVPPPTKAPFL